MSSFLAGGPCTCHCAWKWHRGCKPNRCLPLLGSLLRGQVPLVACSGTRRFRHARGWRNKMAALGIGRTVHGFVSFLNTRPFPTWLTLISKYWTLWCVSACLARPPFWRNFTSLSVSDLCSWRRHRLATFHWPNQLHGAETFWKNQQSQVHVGSLPRSQEHATGYYPKAHESIPHKYRGLSTHNWTVRITQ